MSIGWPPLSSDQQLLLWSIGTSSWHQQQQPFDATKCRLYLALNQCYKVLPCDTISHLPCDMIWYCVTFLETRYDTLWHPFAFSAKLSLPLVIQKATPVHSFAAMHKGSMQLRDRWCNKRVKDPKEKATQTNTIECNPVMNAMQANVIECKQMQCKRMRCNRALGGGSLVWTLRPATRPPERFHHLTIWFASFTRRAIKFRQKWTLIYFKSAKNCEPTIWQQFALCRPFDLRVLQWLW